MLFLEKLEQKKVYIICVITICMLVSIVYASIFMPEKFVSQTSVMLVKIEENGEDEIKSNGNIELTNNQIATFEELIKSDSNIQNIRKKLNLKSEINNKNVSVKRVSDSDAFQIKVTGLNKEDILKMNSEITNSFGNKVLSMYKNTRIYIVDEAHIVSSTKLSTIVIFAIGAFLLGALINLIYIIVLIVIEKNVKSQNDIECNFSLKYLGAIPLRKMDKTIELITSEVEKTSTNNSFKKVRSNIQFLNVNSNKKNIILITNCLGQEGKSYVSANLAISYANVGKKVILIDSNLNQGKQAEIFNIPNNMGMSNFLSNLDETGIEVNERINSYIKETNIKNLNIITSGTVPPNSSELLSSEKFPQMLKDLSVFYDVIILDGASVLNSVDALILSRYATSSIIVSVPKKTKKDDLWKVKRDIQNVGGRIVGVVLNKVKIKEEKEENTSHKVLEKLKCKIKEFLLKFKNYEKQKLLNEATIISNIEENENQILINAIIDEKNEKELATKVEENEEEKIENNQNLVDNNKTKIQKNDEENNIEIEENSIQINNAEEISNIKLINDNINSLKKVVVKSFVKVRKFSKKIFRKAKVKSIRTYKKLSEIIKSKINNLKETKIETSEKKENLEENLKVENKQIKLEKSKSNKKTQSENSVLVIVDANSETCRAFSKNCFTEKPIRGLDTSDGFVKAHYSSYLVRKRVEALILMYSLTKKQASRIDPLVYTTLSDYDEHVWIEQKMTSNKAEAYVLAMAKEYSKNEGEKRKDYIERCKKSRVQELEEAEIEIEYNIELLWKTSKMKFSDKVAMNKYAKIYGNVQSKQNDYDLQYVEEDNEEYIEETEENEVKKRKISLKKINPLKKIEEVTNILTNTEQVRAKSIKEIEAEVDNKLSQKNTYTQENINSDFSQVIVEEENEAYNSELQKQERKKEVEVLKKIQKEKIAKKKNEEKKRREKRKEEKVRQREEQRRAKEMEREKKIEEARIEEELLGDNLYPKTKYNKNL